MAKKKHTQQDVAAENGKKPSATSSSKNTKKNTSPVKSRKPSVKKTAEKKPSVKKPTVKKKTVKPEAPKSPVKVAMLGGIGEIGKNLAMIEYEDDIVVIDCGLGFPDDDMLGIDLVIPDTAYLEENVDRVRGVFLTHGHEDHIGAVPYLLKNIDVPIYGTRLTVGIIQNKLSEHELDFTPRLHTVEAGDTVPAGKMTVEFIRVNHSIADSCAIAVHTPQGIILHSGDFKLDLTPIDGDIMDIIKSRLVSIVPSLNT